MPNSKLIKFALSKASSKNTQEKGKSKWTEKTLFRYLFYVDLDNISKQKGPPPFQNVKQKYARKSEAILQIS